MYLLVDECCGKGLATAAQAAGHAVQRSIDVAALGRGASDAAIFAFAAENGAIVVTLNQGDFIALATRAVPGAGVLLLPSIRPLELGKLFRNAEAAITAIFDDAPHAVVRVAVDGSVEALAGADARVRRF